MKKETYVLLDFSGPMYSSFYSIVGKETDNDIIFNERMPLWKHLILNQIVYYARRFKVDVKNIILCFDSPKIWRREYWKNYKMNRKTARNKSSIDWKQFFEHVNTFKKELSEYFPNMSVEVDGAEGDDVVYVLSKKLSSKYNIIVVSSDKDLTQVLTFDNVKFFNIKRSGGKWINTSKKSIEENKIRHILKGDSSDGIPNVLSDDDTFIVDGKRQKACGDKKINKILDNGLDTFLMDTEIKKNYDRNVLMIDLDMIPENIEKEINRVFIKEFKKEQSWTKAIAWLKQNKFKNILNDLDKFITNDTMEYAENSMMENWGKKVKEKRDKCKDLF